MPGCRACGTCYGIIIWGAWCRFARPLLLEMAMEPTTCVLVASLIGCMEEPRRLGDIPHGRHPSMKCPKVVRDWMRSQTILVIASIGVARIAPGAPHIQYQNTSEMMTSTGLIVNRRARRNGGMGSPSAGGKGKKSAPGRRGRPNGSIVKNPARKKKETPNIGPKKG